MPAPLLSTLPEWQDLAPLELPDDSHAAVDIQYTPEYRDSFGLLYAAIRRGEKSPRVLDLTERCIFLCGAHYTAWDYRFRCLEALDADMDQEWSVCLAIAEANAKSYQIWNHRRRCALRMGAANAPREMEFAAHFLRRDAKNYHIWAHRQALIAEFGGELWAEELRFCEQMLQTDVRNNSAWAQRAFITRHALATHLQPAPADDPPRIAPVAPDAARVEQADDDASPVAEVRAVLEREIEFSRRALAAVPHNESGWNYLLGLEHLLADAARAAPRSTLSGASSGDPGAGGFETAAALDAAAAGNSPDLGTDEGCGAVDAPSLDASGGGQIGGPAAGGGQLVTTPVRSATISTRLVPIERRRSSAAPASPPAPSPLLAAVTTTTITTLTPPPVATGPPGNGADADTRDRSEAALRRGRTLLDGAVFAAALEALSQAPDCVPARSALMQQYVRSACRLRKRGAVAAAAKADGCAAELCEGLVAADPVHAKWYRAMRDSARARCE